MCTNNPHSDKETSEQRHAETMVVNLRQRLYRLEETRAAYGLDTSPHILTEIADLERHIYQWETKLEALKQNDRAISSPIPVPGPNSHSERIQLYLPANVSVMSATQKATTIAVLATLLNITPEAIEIYQVIRT